MASYKSYNVNQKMLKQIETEIGNMAKTGATLPEGSIFIDGIMIPEVDVNQYKSLKELVGLVTFGDLSSSELYVFEDKNGDVLESFAVPAKDYGKVVSLLHDKDVKLVVDMPASLCQYGNMPGFDYGAPRPKVKGESYDDYEKYLQTYYQSKGFEIKLKDSGFREPYPHELFEWGKDGAEKSSQSDYVSNYYRLAYLEFLKNVKFTEEKKKGTSAPEEDQTKKAGVGENNGGPDIFDSIFTSNGGFSTGKTTTTPPVPPKAPTNGEGETETKTKEGKKKNTRKRVKKITPLQKFVSKFHPLVDYNGELEWNNNAVKLNYIAAYGFLTVAALINPGFFLPVAGVTLTLNAFDHLYRSTHGGKPWRKPYIKPVDKDDDGDDEDDIEDEPEEEIIEENKFKNKEEYIKYLTDKLTECCKLIQVLEAEVARLTNEVEADKDNTEKRELLIKKTNELKAQMELQRKITSRIQSTVVVDMEAGGMKL